MHGKNNIVFRSTKQLAALDDAMCHDDKWHKLKVILNKNENGREQKETPFGEPKNLLHYFIDFLFFSQHRYVDTIVIGHLLMVFMFRVSEITANFASFLPALTL